MKHNGETPMVFGHRGAAGHAPENTFASFQLAQRMGVDAIELDVRLTLDRQLVVIHDETLERTTNGSGFVREHTLSELKGLNAGWRFSLDNRTYPFRDQSLQIPTLAEVLCTFPDLFFTLEMKDTSPTAADFVVAVCTQYDVLNRVSIASHEDWKFLLHVRSACPEIPINAPRTLVICFLIGMKLGIYQLHKWPFEAFQVPIRYRGIPVVNSTLIDAAHALGKVVHCWTINHRDEMLDLWGLGVDGIMSDYPDLALETRDAYLSGSC